MAENQAYAASKISESSLGSYRNLTSIGMLNVLPFTRVYR
jgi:hypothetical protein